MASTNKTTHYDLSQYIAGDKPTYLVDYNGDMSTIDTGIYNAQAKANVNESNIGDLSNLDTTVKTDLVSAINEEAGKTAKIGNLSNLTTTANTDLVVAINEVDAEADANTTAIGTLANLETTNKTNLVGAINEVNANVGDLSDLDTTSKSDLVSAINEVRTEEEGTLLWTNSDSSQNFGEQLLYLDLTNYKYVELIYFGGLNSNDVYTQKIYKDDSTELFKPYFYSGNFYLRERVVGWESNDLHIYEGKLNGGQNNGACIPYKVVGFKKDY